MNACLESEQNANQAIVKSPGKIIYRRKQAAGGTCLQGKVIDV